MNLNDDLLEHLIHNFYGSGNYSGDYWFVGMEEGGGNDLEHLNKRFNAWQALGEQELVDIYDFHMKIDYPHYFKDPVKLQRTWMQQARIILASKGKATNVEDIRAYQREIIGRKNSETCLLELLPLPSPSTRVWHYDEWSNLPYLNNRETYRKYCIQWRCKHIRSRINYNHPKLVVFLGKSFYKNWQQVAGNNVIFQDKGEFLLGASMNTIFIICKHPAARGVTNTYFEKIGKFVRNIL